MSETLGADLRDQATKMHHSLRESLPLWTLYRPNGSEGWRAELSIRYPTKASAGVVIHGKTREEVRRQLPPGMTKLMRYPSDPIDVEETWA